MIILFFYGFSTSSLPLMPILFRCNLHSSVSLHIFSVQLNLITYLAIFCLWIGVSGHPLKAINLLLFLLYSSAPSQPPPHTPCCCMREESIQGYLMLFSRGRSRMKRIGLKRRVRFGGVVAEACQSSYRIRGPRFESRVVSVQAVPPLGKPVEGEL